MKTHIAFIDHVLSAKYFTCLLHNHFKVIVTTSAVFDSNPLLSLDK